MALVAYYDETDPLSYPGEPTHNFCVTSSALGIYNNISYNPVDLGSGQTATGETLFGYPVQKITYTPNNVTASTKWTNGANPGVGCYSALYKTYAAGVAYAASIYVKWNNITPADYMWLYYANFGMWNYDSSSVTYYKNGWWRASIIGQHAVGGSDNKYWAWSPVTSSYNQPVDVYWACPQLEQKGHITPYVSESRYATNGWKNLTWSSSLDLNITNMTYDTKGKMLFVSESRTNITGAFTFTGGSESVFFWVKPTTSAGLAFAYFVGGNGWNRRLIDNTQWVFVDTATSYSYINAGSPSINTWHHVGYTIASDKRTITTYLDGVALTTTHTAGDMPTDTYYVLGKTCSGANCENYYSGYIGNLMLFNHELTPKDVKNIYKIQKTKYLS